MFIKSSPKLSLFFTSLFTLSLPVFSQKGLPHSGSVGVSAGEGAYQDGPNADENKFNFAKVEVAYEIGERNYGPLSLKFEMGKNFNFVNNDNFESNVDNFFTEVQGRVNNSAVSFNNGIQVSWPLFSNFRFFRGEYNRVDFGFDLGMGLKVARKNDFICEAGGSIFIGDKNYAIPLDDQFVIDNSNEKTIYLNQKGGVFVPEYYAHLNKNLFKVRLDRTILHVDVDVKAFYRQLQSASEKYFTGAEGVPFEAWVDDDAPYTIDDRKENYHFQGMGELVLTFLPRYKRNSYYLALGYAHNKTEANFIKLYELGVTNSKYQVKEVGIRTGCRF